MNPTAFWILFLSMQCCCAQQGECISVNATARDFYASFSRIFAQSDGSRIQIPESPSLEAKHISYMQDLTSRVHINQEVHGDGTVTLEVSVFLLQRNNALAKMIMCA
jgi:hypothetical protein